MKRRSDVYVARSCAGWGGGQPVDTARWPGQLSNQLEKEYAMLTDFTGKPLKGPIYIAPEGYKAGDDLEYWISLGVSFIDSLPQLSR